jgi:hypothetical protein
MCFFLYQPHIKSFHACQIVTKLQTTAFFKQKPANIILVRENFVRCPFGDANVLLSKNNSTQGLQLPKH